MSFLNFAKNSFFDNDDYSLHAVASAKFAQYNCVIVLIARQRSGDDQFSVDLDMIEVGV